MNNCPYCSIIKGDYQNIHKIIEDREIIAVLMPEIAAGHIMILPKSHITIGIKAEEELYNKLFSTAQKLIKDFRNNKSDSINKIYSSFNILCNTGIDQQVPHLSVHLIPRNEGDNIGLSWNPKQVKEEELEEIEAKLVGAFKEDTNRKASASISKEDKKESSEDDIKYKERLRRQIRRIP